MNDDEPDFPFDPTLRSVRPAQRGEKIAGRYEVVEELGRGGMGIVYRCLDTTSGIEVAVKTLPPAVSHDPAEMEEVRENFRLVSKLIHQRIAAARSLERDPDSGEYVLVMECVDGVDLRSWRRKLGGTVTAAQALPIIRQIAEALDYAHAAKVMHRDIKPSNIKVLPGDKVKILDFGLAAQIHSSLSRMSREYHGTSGTAPYMAPEQWRGKPQDARTDQYALAVLFYELLTGHPPFDNPDPSILRSAVLEEAPDRPDGIDNPVWKALVRALHKDRDKRFPSCVSFVESLAAPEPPPPKKPPKAKAKPKPKKPKPKPKPAPPPLPPPSSRPRQPSQAPPPSWSHAQPHYPQPHYPPVPRKKKSGCCTCMLLFMLLVALAIGGLVLAYFQIPEFRDGVDDLLYQLELGNGTQPPSDYYESYDDEFEIVPEPDPNDPGSWK